MGGQQEGKHTWDTGGSSDRGVGPTPARTAHTAFGVSIQFPVFKGIQDSRKVFKTQTA